MWKFEDQGLFIKGLSRGTALSFTLLPTHLYTYPSSQPPIHAFTNPHMQPSIHPLTHSSMHPSIHPPSQPSIRSQIHVSIHLSTHPVSHPYVHKSMYPSIYPPSTIHPSIHHPTFIYCHLSYRKREIVSLPTESSKSSSYLEFRMKHSLTVDRQHQPSTVITTEK